MTNRMDCMDDNVLLREYLKQQNFENTTYSGDPFVVVMVGLPGSGKSTFAAELSRVTGIYIARNDDVRRFLNKKGYADEASFQTTVENINIATTDLLLKKQVAHIRDADIIRFHAEFTKKAVKYNTPFFTVHVVCNDDVLQQRSVARDESKARGEIDKYQSRAGVRELNDRMRLHQSISYPNYDFIYRSDTTTPEEAVIQFVEFLEKSGISLQSG